MKTKLLLPALLVLFFLIPQAAELWVDYLWFESLGYLSVFTTILSTRLALAAGGLVFTSLFIWLNLKAAGKNIDIEELRLKARLRGFEVFGASSLFVGVIAGVICSGTYMTVLKFFNSTSFGQTEAVFGKDISFYFFKLPFWNLTVGYLLALIAVTIGIAAAFYYLTIQKKKEAEEEFEDIVQAAKKHLYPLGGTLFLLLGVRLYFARYSVLFSDVGAVFGAGYMDLNILLPMITISSVICGVVGILLFANLKLDRIRYPAYGVVALIILLIFGGVGSSLVQSYYVEPNEFNLEEQYLERNIEHTRSAYGIKGMEEVDFDPTYNLTAEDLEEKSQTMDNIRLWDYRVLEDTYASTQELRTYYEFEDVDVDRYRFNGDKRQVMLSVREMNVDKIPEGAQSWVNRHLVYTHGTGAVMSPVKEIEDGQPQFWLKDIPTKVTEEAPSSEGIDLENPDVYFGEGMNNFVVTDTRMEEFDYPAGGENVFTSYDGNAGIELSLVDKLALSISLGDFRLLVSDAIEPESKIMIRRDIKRRAQEIAPFLQYDRDPYPVVNEGRIFWIYDTYTTSDNYPYSEPSNEMNYIRNSVKATVDGYNGDVNYYIVEEEPLAKTYSKIFPDLFKEKKKMDDDLEEHIRYPQDFFSVQAEILSTYHMTNPRVFYNREDQWQVPKESYRGRQQKMEPYYITLELPEKNETQFTLMLPFTPENRPNMVAWLGAKSDQPNYGETILYRFSKEELIYGPSQIESRIDQNAEISEQLTLWDQRGSEVIRGNLLVIPIKDSVLYVEPVFLEGDEEAIPELRRVIVAYEDDIAMEPTLEQALLKIFGEFEDIEVPEEIPQDGELTNQTSIDPELLEEARNHYEEAQKHLEEGNLAGYQEEIEKLGEVLEKMES